MNKPYTASLALLLIQAGATLGQLPLDKRVTRVDRLLANGSVEAAREDCEELVKTTPDSPAVMERLAYICHLTGRYRDAVNWFAKAGDRNPARRTPLLAYSVYSLYLMGEYGRALCTLKEVESAGYQYPVAFFSAEQLQKLIETPPRQADLAVTHTILAMEMVDPLPVVQLRIGSRVIRAVIDTGGPQLVIDSTLAEEEHIRRLSEKVSRGIGGRAGEKVGFAIVEKATLGEIELRNVPVMLMPVRAMSKFFGVQIDAILGTGTLMQFVPTLDFPGKRLILRTKTAVNQAELKRMQAKARLPFLLDDIHSMYAQCSVNNRQPVLFYFDTGLIDDHGAAILTARERLIELGIPVLADSKRGYANISSVMLGSIERRNVKALYGTGKQLTYCEYIKPYGLIGHNFLKYYRWSIDFDNRVFLFDY